MGYKEKNRKVKEKRDEESALTQTFWMKTATAIWDK